MTEKETTSLCCLSTFALIFPTFSAVHFLAFAFLAITFRSKECVITGIEGLMYELRICDKCDCWHSVQDEGHILLDCPHEHLASLHTQHQLAFPLQYVNSSTRLKTYTHQPDVSSVASFVAECLALFPLFFLSPFFIQFQAFSKLPPD